MGLSWINLVSNFDHGSIMSGLGNKKRMFWKKKERTHILDYFQSIRRMKFETHNNLKRLLPELVNTNISSHWPVKLIQSGSWLE